MVFFVVSTYLGVWGVLSVLAYKIYEKVSDDAFFNDLFIWFWVMSIWPLAVLPVALWITVKVLVKHIEEKGDMER